MSQKIKEAYEQGLVTRIEKRPIMTTLFLGGVVYFLYKKFGGAVTEYFQEKRQESADTTGGSTSNVSPFNYTAFNNYWKTGGRLPSKYAIFKDSVPTDIAKKIYDAMGYISDNDDVIKAQIKRCNSKVKVAQVSERFTQLYSRDLLTFLKEGVGIRWNAGLDAENLDAILKYVNSLPTYTK